MKIDLGWFQPFDLINISSPEIACRALHLALSWLQSKSGFSGGEPGSNSGARLSAVVFLVSWTRFPSPGLVDKAASRNLIPSATGLKAPAPCRPNVSA